MARRPNDQGTAEVKIRASDEAASYLDQLVEIGLHGKTRSEVANSLVNEQIRSLITQGILKLRQSAPLPPT